MGSYISLCLSLHKYVLKINKSDCREGALSGMDTEEKMRFAHHLPLYKTCLVTIQKLKFQILVFTLATFIGVKGMGKGHPFDTSLKY